MMTSPAHRCAIVGIVGRTNVGKSTLINRLVGEKVSIVSPVAQTTRNTIRGILTEPRGQLVFVDTPGLHKSEGQLGTLLNRMARQAAANVDVLLVVFDDSHAPEMEDEGWMRRVLFAEQPCVYFLNKIDRPPSNTGFYRERWEQIQREKEKTRALPCLRGSSQSGEGIPELLDVLFALAAPTEALLYPADIVTDYPRRLAIADVIREKLLEKVYEELPHAIGVRVDEIQETPAIWKVSATVLVNRSSQKGLVIGPKGRLLRYVKRKAEPEIGDLFGVAVELELWVKVEKDWAKNFWHLRQMGYAGER